ncbi:MAG TPA: hypothetical protein VFZ59_09375 [Verrucomicrobiae bacterium]|nr:hypothetical protein [Verrucomicrobiae bacterium]
MNRSGDVTGHICYNFTRAKQRTNGVAARQSLSASTGPTAFALSAEGCLTLRDEFFV